MPTDSSQKVGTELEGSDSEASCNTFKIPDVPKLERDDDHSNTFKIPDVPKPNTGADDVADWAAEVIIMRI